MIWIIAGIALYVRLCVTDVYLAFRLAVVMISVLTVKIIATHVKIQHKHLVSSVLPVMKLLIMHKWKENASQ